MSRKRAARGTVDASRYEVLFADGKSDAGTLGTGWVRTKTTKAGNMLSVESYPMIVNPYLRKTCDAEKAKRRTSEAQQRVNDEHSRKRFTALLETNFGIGDVVVTNTYDYGVYDFGLNNMRDVSGELESLGLPGDFDDAVRHKTNYIKRVKNAIKRLGGDPAELKYLWVVEGGKEQQDTDPHPMPRKFHLHIVLSHPMIRARVLSRDTLEAIWGHGMTRCDPVQPDNNGLARLGRYLTKQRRHNRKWSGSRNLKQPTVTISDRKMSLRKSERIAADVRGNAAEIYAKLYPGYMLAEEPVIKYSNYIGGAYIYARLRKTKEVRL